MKATAMLRTGVVCPMAVLAVCDATVCEVVVCAMNICVVAPFLLEFAGVFPVSSSSEMSKVAAEVLDAEVIGAARLVAPQAAKSVEIKVVVVESPSSSLSLSSVFHAEV